jgi:D-alanine--poly(phosphoribitol) ligase subunit 2
MNKDKIVNVIFDSVDEFNEQVEETQRLVKANNTVLFGESGNLDSLGLVNFIVATEQKIEEVFDVSLTLADEKAMSQRNSPFRTIETLAEYISELLMESKNG